MKDTQETVDNTPENEDAKERFVIRAFNAARSRTGKTILAVTGTVGALVGTYVIGFRGGQDNAIQLMSHDEDASDEDSTETLEIEVVVDETDTPEDSPQEN